MNTKVTWLILLTGLYSCGQTTSVNQKPVKPGAGVSSNSKKIESGDAEAADLYDQRSRKKGLVPAVAGNVTTPDLTASVPTQPPLNLVSNPEQMGPMAVKSYTDGLSDSSYSSSIIFYPDDDATAKLPATTLSGGYSNTKEQMTWLAQHLASHGFIVSVFTPTNTNSTDPRIWATGHIGSLNKLKTENLRKGSPIQDRVDDTRLGVMGFSMGGAGTIVAANSLGSVLRAIVPICAYRPTAMTVDVATLFVTGTADTVASPVAIQQSFAQSQVRAPLGLVSFDGLGHQNITNPSSYRRQLSRYLTAWYQVYLAGNQIYATYIDGEKLKEDRARGGIADFQLRK
ncbi:MAG: hypothetical protein NTY08_16695 [Proteobacteria bacterium]|nr:hypothetical protein [Pseudomonadota bacterium]